MFVCCTVMLTIIIVIVNLWCRNVFYSEYQSFVILVTMILYCGNFVSRAL